MKVAVTFLVMLGLLAAVCAMILVKSLTARPLATASGDKDIEVEILVATRDMTVSEIVDSRSVVTKKVPKSQVPDGALLNPVQVVGKVLTDKMVEGQAFTKACFARPSEGVFLAASLPRGKRAVSVSLSDWSGMAGLLYPGSIVDVLVSFRAPGSSQDSVCTTLLQGLQVLAIGSQSVASDDYKDKSPGALSGQKVNQRMVTLLVDPKQAEILQLAIQHGSMSLAMRNPLDTTREGRRMTRSEELINGNPGSGGIANVAAMAARMTIGAAAANRVGRELKPVPADVWEALIIRGSVVEKKTFAEGDVKGEKSAPGPMPQILSPDPTESIESPVDTPQTMIEAPAGQRG
ncbi:Flp pilus assembly protein CpaB [Fontivita pretiosa]|uniref:Flp pilus assembly protein CpaB n=1 Tax=Fontivita pretiosa TaxID=2989684 RepID=UPI003D1723A3